MTEKWRQNDTKMTQNRHRVISTIDIEMTQKWHQYDTNMTSLFKHLKPKWYQMIRKWRQSDAKMTLKWHQVIQTIDIEMTLKWH